MPESDQLLYVDDALVCNIFEVGNLKILFENN